MDVEKLAAALRAALPADLQAHAAELAIALAAAGRNPDAGPVAPELQPLLRALAGQELVAGQSVVAFGAGGQFGDVSIGDVAGGHLNRITLNLAPGASGDVIVGNVGAGAQGVAVGKNIIQIGALVVPVWTVLALAGLLLLVATAAYLRMRGPARMTGTFNVAVADFAVHAGGSVRPSDAGRRLSALAFEALRQQQEIYKQANPADVISIWHDSLGWREKSTAIGYIGGASVEERERAARALLDQLAADMLIYGYVGGDGQVTLRFYVRPELKSEGLGGAIGGDYQVGQPLSPTGTRLTTRAGAIFWLIKGLQYDSEGRPERSLDVLGRAEAALPDWRERGEGKELLALLQAQATLYLARLASEQEEFMRLLAEAEGYVRVAEERNSDQLRVAVMAGNVHLLRAQCLLGAEGLPCTRPPGDPAARSPALAEARAELAPAVAHYERAVELGAGSPDWLWSRGVAPAALGFAYFVRGEIAFLAHDDAAAAADYLRAAAAIGPALETLRGSGAQRLLAEQYLVLGSAYLRGGELAASPALRQERYRAAADALAACVALGAGSGDELLSAQIAPACAERQRLVEEGLN